MSESKTYLQDELSEKVPQKIIAHLTRTDIDEDEKILAMFGSASFTGIGSCVLSTEDRLIYVNTSGLIAKTTIILYSDLSDVSLKTEGKSQWIYLVCADGKSVKLDIAAPAVETQKMYDFISGYKETGAKYIEQRLSDDADYLYVVDAIRKHKNLKIAKLEQKSQKKKAEIHTKEAALQQQHKEKSTLIHEEYEDKVAQINEKYDNIHQQNQDKIAKVHEKYNNIQQQNQDKINKIANARPHSRYNLDYSNSLAKSTQSTAKITVNGPDQVLEIELPTSPVIQIPLADVKGSYVTTDVEIPPDDVKNEYRYYLHMQYTQNGQEKEMTFSHMQKQNVTVDPIHQLNYALQHIDEKIKWANDRNARYDEREQRLLAQREQLLAQRSAQIGHLHEIFNPGSNTTIPRSTGTPELTSVPQNTSSNPPSTASAADEIKKFKALLDEGILTQEEFDAKKKQLLNL